MNYETNKAKAGAAGFASQTVGRGGSHGQGKGLRQSVRAADADEQIAEYYAQKQEQKNARERS